LSREIGVSKYYVEAATKFIRSKPNTITGVQDFQSILGSAVA